MGTSKLTLEYFSFCLAVIIECGENIIRLVECDLDHSLHSMIINKPIVKRAMRIRENVGLITLKKYVKLFYKYTNITLVSCSPTNHGNVW